MSIKHIPFLDLEAQKRRMGEGLRQRLDHVLSHHHYIMGPEVFELEEQLASYSGVRHAIAVSSGTDALLAIMMGEKITAGDAVFLPAFTYTATAEIVLLLGAHPVFVDIDKRSFQICPISLKKRLEELKKEQLYRPRALIGVDLFGQPAPWSALKDIAQEYGLFLVADTAQAFGASYYGKKLGSQAEATALSFFPSKTLGCYGDGGAILTNCDKKAALYRSLRSHGEGKERYDVQHIGLNARLDTLQAAILLAKLEIFDEELLKRDDVAKAYDRAMPASILPPLRGENASPAWSVYAILLENSDLREALRAYLAKKHIPTAIYYPKPLHHQPAYAQHHDGSALPVAEEICRKIMALPLHPYLDKGQQDFIISSIKEWHKEIFG